MSASASTTAVATAAAAGAGANFVDLRGASPEELRLEYDRVRRAIEGEPNDTGHWLHLASLCLQLGRKEEGKGVLVRLLEREPAARAAAIDLLRGILTPEQIEKLPQARERLPFYEIAGDVLRYPFRGNGPVLLAGGGIVFAALYFLARITSVFWWIPALFSVGYLAAYFLSIIDTSGRGQSEPPDYPDYLNFWESVLGPFWMLLSASIIPGILPVGYLLIFGVDWWVVLLILAGLWYWPMSMMMTAIFQSGFMPLNVPMVLRAIRACGKEYWLAVGVIHGLAALAWALERALEGFLPGVFAQLLAQTIGLYFGIAEMHILGVVYHNHDRAIGWFPDAVLPPLPPPSAPTSSAPPSSHPGAPSAPPSVKPEPKAGKGGTPPRESPRAPERGGGSPGRPAVSR